MHITILSFIMVIGISLFVGYLIGYAHCFRVFTKALKDRSPFG